MPGVDLHIHSTASDGRLSPAEIVRKAAGLGLTVIAITDHDTIDGISSALETAKAFPQLKVIPGIELSTDTLKGEVHVLGYFIDYMNSEFQDALNKMRNSRFERAQRMIAKLKGLGLTVQWERVREIAGSASIGRPHIAEAMFEKGYITSIKEAFDKYLAWGKPAYVEREKMSPGEIVTLILKVRGVPVLAHPLTIDEPEPMVKELKAHGLVGLEVYYDACSDEEIKRLLGLAAKYGLIATGGSDYHGLDINETMLGGSKVPLEAAERLIALGEKRELKTIQP